VTKRGIKKIESKAIMKMQIILIINLICHHLLKRRVSDKIVGKISSTTMGWSQEYNSVNLSESARVSNNVRIVILGLFALIGFIILVFAVFTASVGGQLNQVQFANSVFIAAIVGAFTLVGVIVYQIRGGNGR
jgi:hypothetical protein